MFFGTAIWSRRENIFRWTGTFILKETRVYLLGLHQRPNEVKAAQLKQLTFA